MSIGTPKMLLGAIQNGLEECESKSHEEHDMIIRSHVRDFLAQKFSTAMLRHPSSGRVLSELFKKIGEL